MTTGDNVSNITDSELQEALVEFNQTFSSIESEITRVIVGMQDIVRLTLSAVFAGGHVLLEGVPGLGKTLLVKSIAQTLGMSFKRIQFTPDLMPSDVTGTQVLTEDEQGRRNFEFKPGPVFANIVLADEINRATPKTQSALLEAMEEKQITVLNETHALPRPFFVLATQNPIELEGTYPLPEAQLDRFLMKLLLKPPGSDELKEVLNRTTGTIVPQARCVFPEGRATQIIEAMRLLVRKVMVADPMQEVLVRMIAALTPDSPYATEKVKRYVRFGPGPRGAQAVMMAGKVAAVLDSRINLAFEDIRTAILPALRHRLVLNFQAEADGVTADQIIEEVKNAR
ncbi:MAG: AAA family ATPase [Candidatus Dadabacteria bacterium]|nr:MAG: AAA family ATPase [Candidatus Dadabacteria bacterium]